MADAHLLVFEETQRFRHPGVWALVAVPGGFAWFAAVWQVVLGHRFGDTPLPTGSWWRCGRWPGWPFPFGWPSCAW